MQSLKDHSHVNLQIYLTLQYLQLKVHGHTLIFITTNINGQYMI